MKSTSPLHFAIHRLACVSMIVTARGARVCSAVVILWALVDGTSVSAQRFSVRDGVSSDPGKTPLILLVDNQSEIEAAIAPSKGGELSGLKIRHRGEWIESIYLARDYSPREGWTGKAPLLWPATGRNFTPELEARRKAGEVFHQGEWIYQGKSYPMPIHGFARDLSWQVDHKQASADRAHARLSLRDTEQTRKSYPFGFSLEVTYTLQEGYLAIAYQVIASEQNADAMPFSIGNHITFVCPLVRGSDSSATQLVTPSTTELLKTRYGIPTGEKRPRSHAAGVLLGEFERRSAVSLTGYSEDPYIIYRDPQGLAIRMSHTASEIPDQPIVLFNIWGDAAAGFFSPEPWIGLQNSLVLNQGLVRLSPGDHFDWTIRIEFQRD